MAESGDPKVKDDLSALSWVQDEVRRSLELAHKALRRHLKESAQASDLDRVDPGVLRQARSQFHQSVGVLELVGLGPAAELLRAAESAVQRLSSRPRLITAAAVDTIEQGSFALLDYIGRLLAAKPVSALALFPQYRALQELAGASRIHPADLWSQVWSWQPVPVDTTAVSRQPDASCIAQLERDLLGLMRGAPPSVLARMSDTFAGLAAHAQQAHPRDTGHTQLATLWQLAAAFYEAQADGVLKPDVYCKRVGSKLLGQLHAGVDAEPSLRLAQDLLFFCAQARASSGMLGLAGGPRLKAVRRAFSLADEAPVDFEVARLGRFDPALLAQARKRVSSAKEVWSAVAGGDLPRLPGLNEQFALVADSLQRLYPEGSTLGRALQVAVAQTTASGQEPAAELAMEVATALLYLDASLDDGELDHPDLVQRVQRLAQRIDQVRQQRDPGTLELWMEDLYRRVSDRQTMGSVVAELRASLSEVEKNIDQYFRNPAQREVLIPVPAQMQAMRGVLSVLDLDQASQAVLRMRDDVDALANTEVDPQRAIAAGTFDRLADNLGALSFLIDMVSVQPQMAKSLFVFDAASGTLSAVMAREDRPSGFDELDTHALGNQAALGTQDTDALAVTLDFDRMVRRARDSQRGTGHSGTTIGNHGLPMLSLSDHQRSGLDARPAADDERTVQMRRAPDGEPIEQTLTWPAAIDLASGAHSVAPEPAPSQSSGLEDDPEMRAVFLEEAHEVLLAAGEALAALQLKHDDLTAMTTLRRGFHTLKGSARMVGLMPFGEAAWSCEQLYNVRLADHHGADGELRGFTLNALQHFERWVQALEAGDDKGFDPSVLVLPADALRVMPRHAAAATSDEPALARPSTRGALLAHVPELPLASDLDLSPVAGAESPMAPVDWPDLDLAALDFDAQVAATPVDFPVDMPTDLPQFLPQELPAEKGRLQGLEASALPAAGSTGDFDQAASPTEHMGLSALPVDANDSASQDTALSPLRDELDALPLSPITEGDLDTRRDTGSRAAEEFKQIGALRIGIPLFNIFLNEADELSRRLAVELAEWTLEQQRPVGDDAVAMAHSLAGNSATVGFADLSDLARAMEAALGRSHDRGYGQGDEAVVFAQAADEVRRLLHLFAAGYLSTPDADLLHRLQQLAHAAPDSDLDQVLAQRETEQALQDQAEAELAEALQAQAELAARAAVGQSGSTGKAGSTADGETEAASAPAALRTIAAPLGRASLMPFNALPETPSQTRQFADALDIDDEIDAQDALDADLFPIFEEEAVELLAQLHGRLRDWSQRPAQAAAASACMRSLHTFKGSARLAGAMRLGELAHRLESGVERVAALGAAASAEAIEPLISHADALAAHFDLLRAPSSSTLTEPSIPGLHSPLATVAAALAAGTSSAQARTAPTPVSTPAPQSAAAPEALAASPARHTGATPVATIDWQRFAKPAHAADMLQVNPAGTAVGNTSVRVRGPLLDRLVNHAGEVSIARARITTDVQQFKGSLGDLNDNLERLRSQLRDLELQAETQISTRLEAQRAAQQGFDPLEMDRFTRFQELTRMIAESVGDVATVQRSLQRTLQSTEDALAHQARMTRDMQDDLLRTRMVEFEGLSERLYRVVRQTAKETGKPVRLDIVGGTVEIDRGVLDRMMPAFEHLLRNSVVHGIEPAAHRVAAGKDATGSITLTVAQLGNEVAVEVRDDGAGLNETRIRERALALGLIHAEARPDLAELANLVFQPGFSTTDEVTDLAGRGVGMDVVRTDVNAMGGRIETASAPGQGASFRLVLPLTTAVTQVVMLRCGQASVAVPATLVAQVQRLSGAELIAGYETGVVRINDREMPFFWLAGLLQGSSSGVVSAQGAEVAVVRSADQFVVLHVDEVLGNQEVVIKNLGPQLARQPGLVGMTLLPTGLPAAIYNPVALATLYGSAARAAAQDEMRLAAQGIAPGAKLTAQVLAPLVLVVDDSLTVRRVTQRLLEREGYRVALAKDGLDGLDQLSLERPAVLLTDIEMPRMDGFDLVRHLRAQAELADLPVVMITSRLAQKHRDYAAELGVDHYLGKPYSEDELLRLVARYARRERVGA